MVIYYTSAGSARAVTHSPSAGLAYCRGVTSEGHPFHQLFYLHPKLYVHEKCASVFAEAHRGRSNFCSLMHANLCRWHHYCWKMDCLIKHIIWHICCLADQIEVVFCTNFFVKFVSVHVIFVLGHGKRRKFQACHAGPICSRFWGWTDFFHNVYSRILDKMGFFFYIHNTSDHCLGIWRLIIRSVRRILLKTALYITAFLKQIHAIVSTSTCNKCEIDPCNFILFMQYKKLQWHFCTTL